MPPGNPIEEHPVTITSARTNTSPSGSTDTRGLSSTREPSSTRDGRLTRSGRYSLAALRLGTGFIFLWAFLDKTFGLGFSTPIERAWINGGAPSQGFLNSDAVVGPLKGFFAAIASPLTDVLFMAGMLGIGAAVMLGIGLRVSAVAGSVIMVFMYLAEWPFAALTASNNPLVDYHIVYALALIAVAATYAGDTWGFGVPWRKLAIVRSQPWLI
jgi:thiosulfate dehydrogenase [quinone] large subunit